MIDETLFEAEEKMEKAVAVAKDDFAAIRTGRANPAMFNKIVVDYYGAPTPVNQLASFHVAEARMLIAHAVRQGRDGAPSRRRSATPTSASTRPTTATIIRVVFPQLTEERRKEFIKVAQHKAEDAADLDPQRPPARQGRAGQAGQGRRGRRGRRRPRREGARGGHPASTSAQVDELLKHKESELLEV